MKRQEKVCLLEIRKFVADQLADIFAKIIRQGDASN